MKNSLNEPDRLQSQALYCKVKATFQFSPQGEMGMTLPPALSRPTGEGESFAVAGEYQGAVFTGQSQECRETFDCCSPLPSDGSGVWGEGRRAL
jgi:hypothetical protein